MRLLPLIGGFVVGVGAGTRIANRIGHKIPIAVGLLLTGAGLAIGATTDTASGFGFAALWYAITGLGIGAALTPSMDALLAVLPPERAGSGTAITMTLRQAGGALGVALLGRLLSQVYTDRLVVDGLPPQAAETARDSIAGAVAVAARAAQPALIADAQAAYIDGMRLVLIVCAVIAVVGAALTVAFMPGRTRTLQQPTSEEYALA